MRYRRPCKRCLDLFIPEGKYCYFCIKCKKNPGNNVKERDSEIIRHRNKIRAVKRLEAPTQADSIKLIPIPFKSRKDLCPICRINMKLEVSNRCRECYSSKKNSQLARIKSLKEKRDDKNKKI